MDEMTESRMNAIATRIAVDEEKFAMLETRVAKTEQAIVKIDDALGILTTNVRVLETKVATWAALGAIIGGALVGLVYFVLDYFATRHLP